MLPDFIIELDGVAEYLEKRQLISQYQKAKRMILSGHNSGALFKKREPKDAGIWYFRINRQYRAVGYFPNDGRTFAVTYVDDHQ